jgi:hypothetical protein
MPIHSEKNEKEFIRTTGQGINTRVSTAEGEEVAQAQRVNQRK